VPVLRSLAAQFGTDHGNRTRRASTRLVYDEQAGLSSPQQDVALFAALHHSQLSRPAPLPGLGL